MISPKSTSNPPLRSGHPDTAPVGLVLLRSAQPGQLDRFHQEFIRGVEQCLAESGRSLLVMLEADPDQETATYKRWAEQGRIAGVILMNMRPNDERVPLLQELGLPAVVIGDSQFSTVHPAAYTDDRAAMVEALEYLSGLGHKHIARIAGPAEFLHTAQRTEVYTQLMAEAGVPGTQRNGDYSFECGRDLTAELFTQDGPAPTAIIYDDAVMAMGGLEALAVLGIEVPDQVSVLAWDDSVQCQLAGVSALSHDVAAYGRLAAELFVAHLAGAPATSRAAAAPTLVSRRSTGAVSTTGPTD